MDRPLLKIPEDFSQREAHALAEDLFDRRYKVTNASISEETAEKLIFDLWNKRVIERLNMDFDSRMPYVRDDVYSVDMIYDQQTERWNVFLWCKGITDLRFALDEDCEYNMIGALKEAIRRLGLLEPVTKIDFERIY